MRFLPARSSLLTAALVALLVVAAGCSGSNKLRYDSPQEAFEKGLALHERGKHQDAIRYFRAVIQAGRTNEWADDAQLYLGRAYRADKRYLLAANEYLRFIELHRGDERVPTAEYERAMSYYALSPGYQLDQTQTRQALNAFQLFVDRHPQNELVPQAEAKIEELREKLAHKQYGAAQLYERREMYEAAAVSYETVFDQYPETTWADDALLGAINAYIEYSDLSIRARQPERLRQAIKNYERLVQIFPDSPHLEEAEALYEKAAARLEALGESAPLAGKGG